MVYKVLCGAEWFGVVWDGGGRRMVLEGEDLDSGLHL